MPTSGSGNRGTVSRRVAPFAPLALALLLQRAVIPGGGGSGEEVEHGEEAAVCADDIEGFRGCHSEYPTGCTKAGKYDAYLNLFKNQLIPPKTAPVGFLAKSDFANLDRNTPKDLTRGNHADMKDALGKLGEGQVRVRCDDRCPPVHEGRQARRNNRPVPRQAGIAGPQLPYRLHQEQEDAAAEGRFPGS